MTKRVNKKGITLGILYEIFCVHICIMYFYDIMPYLYICCTYLYAVHICMMTSNYKLIMRLSVFEAEAALGCSARVTAPLGIELRYFSCTLV